MSKVASLKEHAIPIRSVEPTDEDFSDLQPLKAIFGKAQVVLLGEPTHGDGTTFLAKTRLIKFLHQQMGFDVLAFESGLYDCRKAWELLRDGENPVSAVRRGVYGIWTQSEQFQPLIDYLGSTATTHKPLELAGVDCQFRDCSREFLVTDLETFLKHLEIKTLESSQWPQFKTTFQKLIQSEIVSEDEQDHFFKMLEELQRKLKASISQDAHTASFWIQLLESSAQKAKIQWRPTDTFAMRDQQMGQSLLWLAREYYPNRKIIVWAATVHIIYNPTSGKPIGWEDNYKIKTSMGHVVRQELGERCYALGFTAYEGQYGIYRMSPQNLDKPNEGDLEDLMHAAELDCAVVDFRQSVGMEWLYEMNVSRPVGYGRMEADWTQMLDGIMFTRTMTPSTRARR